jgi:hypothetical protein
MRVIDAMGRAILRTVSSDHVGAPSAVVTSPARTAWPYSQRSRQRIQSLGITSNGQRIISTFTGCTTLQ